jgi:hypothetical protein
MIRVAAASVDITPDRPLDLGGSWSRAGPVLSTGVDEALEANLLLIDSPEECVILVSLDALFAGPDAAKDVASVCARGGHPVRVFALATHTHRAPMLDRGKPRLGKRDERWYCDVLVRICHAAEKMLKSVVAAGSLSVACRDVRGSVGRRSEITRPVIHGRRLKRSGPVTGPNPDAACAPACRCAVLRQASGSVVCVLVCWACHPSDYPEKDRVSPDFIGPVRTAVRSAVGECPVLFLQGFSGDVRPHVPIAPTIRNVARRLVRGPVFMTPTLREWQSWANSIGAQIAGIAEEAQAAEGKPADTCHISEANVPISSMLGGRDRGLFRACSLTIGAVELVMMTAEVSAEYAQLVECVGAWPVGCLDNVFGYLPTDAQIPEGGYEVEGFRGPFGISGRFIGNNDATFRRLLSDVCANAGQGAAA